MIGISGCSIYIPRYRLSRESIARAWGGRPPAGAKSVSNFDEDALTMGYSAAWSLGGPPPGRLYFASTTAPYWQRSAAGQIAAACDWGPETGTTDLGGSLRSGFSALLAGFDAVAADTANDVVVVAADRRDAPPESAEELAFGDAAVALRIGREPAIAELLGCVSRSDDFLDEWRRESDLYVHGYSSRYTFTRGYEANVAAAVKALLAKCGVETSQVAFFALGSPDGRAHIACAKTAGMPADRLDRSVMDGGAREVGVSGSPMPLIALAQALASAKPGDLVLAAAYGDGAAAVLFRVIAPAPPVNFTDDLALEYPSYSRYRKSREFQRQEERGPEISNVLWKKEERQNVRLHGTKCPECGTVQYPIARVCIRCRNSERLEEIALRRTGRVFTFTKDYLYDAPVQPTVMTVLDLDGGGRFLCQMTDVDERAVRIGMEVELVLRRMRDGGQNHHYYWKSRPLGK